LAVSEAYEQHRADLDMVKRSMELMSQGAYRPQPTDLTTQLHEREATERALRENEDAWPRLHQVAGLGNWIWDIASRNNDLVAPGLQPA
jgi:hypothetical protein